MIKEFKELIHHELYDILALRNEVFIVEQNCPYLDIDHKDKDALHLMIYDRELVAYLRILDKNVSYDEVSIGRVLVKESHRGQKLGQKIMIEAIEYIKDVMKEDKIRISAQAYLKSFYESLGFKCVSDIYLEDDIPHIEMLYDM